MLGSAQVATLILQRETLLEMKSLAVVDLRCPAASSETRQQRAGLSKTAC